LPSVQLLLSKTSVHLGKWGSLNCLGAYGPYCHRKLGYLYVKL